MEASFTHTGLLLYKQQMLPFVQDEQDAALFSPTTTSVAQRLSLRVLQSSEALCRSCGGALPVIFCLSGNVYAGQCEEQCTMHHSIYVAHFALKVRGNLFNLQRRALFVSHHDQR